MFHAPHEERPDARPKARPAEPQPPTPPALLLALQQGAGNRATTAILARGRGNKGGATKTKVAKPKKVKLTLDDLVAAARADAVKGSTKAAGAATKALEFFNQAALLVTDVEAFATDPLVSSNGDVLASVQAAIRKAELARDEAKRHADVSGLHAKGAQARADEAATTGPDAWSESTGPIDAVAKKAHNLAGEAEKARDRAESELKTARSALKDAQRAREQVELAKSYVTTSTSDARSKAGTAITQGRKWNITVTKLEQAKKSAGKDVADEAWRERRTDLVALDSEAERVLGFVSMLDEAEDRASAGGLTQPQRVEVRTLIQAARLELQRDPRDDAACGTKLALIGAKLDEFDDAAAQLAGTAAARQQLINEGRMASNRTVIQAETRAGLAGNEKTAVEEILKAIADGDTVSPFGGKFNDYHGNNGGDLPGVRGGGGYAEYYVRKAPGDAGWGARRLVQNLASHRWYYSRTHYGANGQPAFVLLTGA